MDLSLNRTETDYSTFSTGFYIILNHRSRNNKDY